METIKIIEQELEEWKAALWAASNDSVPPATFYNGGVSALRAAIRKAKKPLNKVVEDGCEKCAVLRSVPENYKKKMVLCCGCKLRTT